MPINLKQYIRLARPHQYLKNSFIWLPLFFGYKLHDAQAILQTFYGFCAFSLAASSVYVLNDLMDVADDRRHPVKKFRPLAAGAVKPRAAIGFAGFLLICSVSLLAATLPPVCLVILAIYFFLNVGYSFGLKHIAILDIACISIGFVLRVFMGGVTAQVEVSHWIVVMTFLLALFFALGKRRDDLILAASGHNTRKSLDGYSLEFVSGGIVTMASVVIVAYILYTVSPVIIAKHGTNKLYLTGFWVVLGILKYMQITFVEQQSGSPTQVVMNNRFLQLTVLGWFLSFYILLYIGNK